MSFCRDADDFAECIKEGLPYRIPARVVWPPETLAVPEGMTPERLRVMAGDDERNRWATVVTLLRWADDLAAQIQGGGADDREASDQSVAPVTEPPPPSPDVEQRHDLAVVDGEPVEQWRWDELRAERDALAARLAALPEVPEGCELVVLPTEVVDHAAAFWPSESKGHTGPVGDACRAAVARRPPKPRTVKVPWWDLPGRTLTNGKHVAYVRRSAEGRIDYTSDGPGGTYWHLRDVAPDGTVEVLVEDGES